MYIHLYCAGACVCVNNKIIEIIILVCVFANLALARTFISIMIIIFCGIQFYLRIGCGVGSMAINLKHISSIQMDETLGVYMHNSNLADFIWCRKYFMNSTAIGLMWPEIYSVTLLSWTCFCSSRNTIKINNFLTEPFFFGYDPWRAPISIKNDSIW